MEIELIIENIMKKLKEESILCKKPYDFLLLKSRFLGENSEIKMILKGFSIEDKKKYGKLIQIARENITNFIKNSENNLQNVENIDVFLSINDQKGKKHVLSQTIQEMKSILIQMGFDFFDAPEIESEFRNFTALNVGELHPCRDDHQSFFLNNDKILRTHTSNIQSYVIEQKKENFQVFTIGKVYRRDLDATHTPMFHQLEVFSVTKKSNLREMFKTLRIFLSKFFEIEDPEIRIRPSFFPFTEPSYEIDMKFNGNWLELLGSGITHPNVFKSVNEIPKLGFAFGCGVDRFAMIKNNIKDIRNL